MASPRQVLVWVAIVVVVVAAAGATFVNLAGGPQVLQPLLSRLQLPASPWHPFGGGSNASTIDAAEQALARGDFVQARRLADKAVNESASDAQVLNRAGNVAVQTDDDALGERAYSLGESADAQYPWNFVELGQLYAREGKVPQADAHLRAAVGLAPDAQFLHFDLGVVELREHLYAAALADFEAELHRSPKYAPAIAGRAEALKNLGRGAEAALALRGTGARPKGPLQLQRVQTPAPRASPKPTPTPEPTAEPSPSPSPTRLAQATPKPTPKAKPKPKASANTVVAAAGISSNADRGSLSTSGEPLLRPVKTPVPTKTPAALLADLAADGKSYLLGVARDLNFTHALPAADPDQSTKDLETKLDAAARGPKVDIEAMLRVGTSALLSGRFSLASTAFVRASEAAPSDWRGPYLAGLVAQARGDLVAAQAMFKDAVARGNRPEAYTSLSVIALQQGSDAVAYDNARRAVALDPGYEPGRFVLGILAMGQADTSTAERNLAAAAALGGSPARTQYFLTALTTQNH